MLRYDIRERRAGPPGAPAARVHDPQYIVEQPSANSQGRLSPFRHGLTNKLRQGLAPDRRRLLEASFQVRVEAQASHDASVSQ